MTEPSGLVRLVATPDGGLAVGRHLPGRGAWLCAGSEACVAAATRRKAFSRALRREIRGDAVAALQSTTADRARIEASLIPLAGWATAQPGSTSRSGTAFEDRGRK